MTRGAARSGLLCVLLLLGTLAGLLLSYLPSSPPPEVEYSGCWAFYSSPEPVCTPWPDGRFKLWVRAEPGDRVEIRGGDLAEPGKIAGPGLRYKLILLKQASSLVVTVYPRSGNKEAATWSLRLAEPDMPDWFDQVDKLSGTNPQKARRLLKDLPPSARDKYQSFVLAELVPLAENSQEAEKLLRQRADWDRSSHHWSGEVEAVTSLSYRYVKQGRLSEATQLLKTVSVVPLRAPADDKHYVTYYLGILAESTGDYGAALKQLREAANLADWVGMPGLESNAIQLLALVYQELGRPQEASKLYTKLLAGPDLKSGCATGGLWTNVGWFQLMEHEAGNTAELPVPALQKALANFETSGCSSHQRLNAHLNLALAYQQQDQWPDATRELSQAQSLAESSTLPERLWLDDLEARIALHNGRPELALGLYEKLERRSELAASPAGILQALLGRARANIAKGDQQAAIDALAKADVQIEKQSQHIPIDQGRDTFFAYQEAATRLYLRLLLDDEKWQKAFDLARKSRSRLLRQLAVRDRLNQLDEKSRQAWRASLAKYHTMRDMLDRDAASRWKLAVSEKAHALEDEAQKLKDSQEQLDSALGALNALGRAGEEALTPPERDEVIVAYHPLPGKQWAAFAATKKIEVAYFELPEKLPGPEQLAQLLLTPSQAFRSAVAGAKSVRILPYGPLRTVDFHALPFTDGQPLLATHRVVYSLDLPKGSASPTPSGHPMALVVSDPTEDLRTAKTEGKTVTAAIQRWPGAWTPTPLNGSEAKASKVRDALAKASFFHYAGHGSFAGFAGWSSELPLADHSRLTLSDILALGHTPDSVVLSACDAGHTSEEAPGEGVGLANAFLLAGSKEVVAARQWVPDSSANELMAEMYSHWQPREDLQQQLRRAQLTCARKNPSPCASWASFRVLVP
jgi:tetratricopeptide (TPR) repeat protein